MKEAHVEHHLVKRVRAAGGEVRKLKWIGRRGAPDRFVSMPGLGVWLVELKRPGLGAEDHQAREHERLRDTGVRVALLDTIEAVDEFFDKLRTGGV